MRVVNSGDPLDADDTFVHRLVGQPWRADKVADREDVGFAGAQPFVDDDMTSFDRDAGVFEADIFDIAEDADGKDDALDGELAPLPSSFDAIASSRMLQPDIVRLSEFERYMLKRVQNGL